MKFINKEILFNTFKISTAAIIGILIASLLDLNYAISAGTVAILSIQPTKRETIRTAVGRVLAFLCALFTALICFNLLGYTMIAFVVFLIVQIFVCQVFRWTNSMAMTVLLMSHFLVIGNMQWETILNECLIFLIGVGIGITANLHLRKNVNYIEELKESTDEQIRRILSRMSERILNSDMTDYNSDCFTVLKDSIRKAKNVADANYNNQLRVRDTYDKEYIRMRERQCLVLYEMYKSVRQIHTTPITAKKISDFLQEMSSVYHKTNTGRELMEQFREMDLSMKSKPLPTERIEFEDRARLFYLLRYIEEFIQIKIDFSEQYLKAGR